VDLGLLKGYEIQDLNLGALGTFSPLKIRSAPTALPLPGQPYFGPNTLHELVKKIRLERKTNSTKLRKDFIENVYGLNVSKANKSIRIMQ
jgi:hypothetical protein